MFTKGFLAIFAWINAISFFFLKFFKAFMVIADNSTNLYKHALNKTF